MKDCVGKELKIGDKVVCSDMKYADLLIGEIIGFTPKKARVRYQRSEYGSAYGVLGQHEQLKEEYQIFKYEAKSEAYKEFADKLAQTLGFRFLSDNEWVLNTMQNLLKELVGDEQ